jgi:nucleoside-diphosphate-sugar epimerase
MNTATLSMKDRRVLVLGGMGYVGTVLMPYLMDIGWAVSCADLLLYENGPLALPFWDRAGFRFRRVDLRDDSTYGSIMEEVTDVVVLAALVGDPITKIYPHHSAEINVDGLKRFLGACSGRRLRRVVFISTCSNYGMRSDDTPATESSELNPLSVYARNKVDIERYLTGVATDLQVTILRLATAFGLSPRMRFDLTVSEFTRELYLGRELQVYDPDTWRPYCHVKDIACAINAVLTAPEAKVSREIFNVGGNMNNLAKRSIIEIITKHVPGAKISYKQHGFDPRNYRVDFSKIRRELDFTPRYTVEAGVLELLDALARGVFDDVETRPNFYGNRTIPLFDAELAAPH